MWNAITRFVVSRPAAPVVVLTTHSMEECAALCNRVGIMVAGQLSCLGSIPHLQARFGDTYQLAVKLAPARPADVAALEGRIAEAAAAAAAGAVVAVAPAGVAVEGTHAAGRGGGAATFPAAFLPAVLAAVEGDGGHGQALADAEADSSAWGVRALIDGGNGTLAGGGSVSVARLAAWLVVERAFLTLRHDMLARLPHARLRERHGPTARFMVPVASVTLPGAFAAMNDVVAAHSVEAYAVSQTTLDDIFAVMAGAPPDEEEAAADGGAAGGGVGGSGGVETRSASSSVDCEPPTAATALLAPNPLASAPPRTTTTTYGTLHVDRPLPPSHS